MRHPLRRLSLFLTVIILCQLFSAPVLAAGTILPQREHLEISFDSLRQFSFSQPDFSLAADDAELLCQDAAYAERVAACLDILRTQYLILDTQLTLLSIASSQNVFDDTVNDQYLDLLEISYDVDQRMSEVVSAVLGSPCGTLIDQTDMVFSMFLWEYDPMDDVEEQLYLEEQTLVDQYYAAAGQDFYAEIDGKTYDEDALYDAALDGVITWEAYDDGTLQIAKNQNEALAGLYVKLVENRKKQAALYGYEDYAQMQDDYTYYRDYTRGEVAALSSAVKTYIVPVARAMEGQLWDTPDISWAPDALLQTLRQACTNISEELLPALDYMTEYGYYDIAWSGAKSAGAFTTALSYPGAPFLLMEPEQDFTDFTSLVHEFGHYNAYFCSEDLYRVNLDLSEIHSQGLELLMLDEYESVFGEDARAAQLDTVWFTLTSLIDGCMMDELERYAYNEPDLTVEKLNRKYAELLRSYGYWTESDRETEAYSWVTTAHIFEYPLYYISYAVSAAGAFDLWEMAQDDRPAAIDTYLHLVALGEGDDFFATLRQVGLSNPMTKDAIQQLSVRLTEVYLQDDSVPVMAETPETGFPLLEFLMLALCYVALNGTVIFIIVLVTQRKRQEAEL